MAQIQSSIILLEDDLSLSRAMERVLRISGFHTLTFRTFDALAKTDAAETAACLVFDTSAVRDAGPDVRQTLKARANTPLIFISGYDEPEDRATSEASGNATFLPKPFSGRKLVETVHRLLMPDTSSDHGTTPD